jgi:hypothetical protein
MATNEMQNGCGSSIEAARTSNQKRRREKSRLAASGALGCLERILRLGGDPLDAIKRACEKYV